MPISKSAKKSLRVAERKTSLNRYRKVLIKAATKNVTAETFSKAVSMIDKGVKWGLYHQNRAARMKSSLAKLLPANAKITPKLASEKATTSNAKSVKTTAKKVAPKKPATKRPSAKK